MNTILLTSGTDRQTAADDRPMRTAIVQPAPQAAPARGYRKWKTGEAGLETALFVSVQAVMMACIVLVAVQLFATA